MLHAQLQALLCQPWWLFRECLLAGHQPQGLMVLWVDRPALLGYTGVNAPTCRLVLVQFVSVSFAELASTWLHCPVGKSTSSVRSSWATVWPEQWCVYGDLNKAIFCGVTLKECAVTLVACKLIWS